MLGDGYMTRKEASAYLISKGIKISYNTLNKYASIGGGPLMRYFGSKPLYRAEDLDGWVVSRLSAPCSSTSARAI